jgi:hypothetical protein
MMSSPILNRGKSPEMPSSAFNMSNATKQLLFACEWLKEMDSYERPLTQWIAPEDERNIIRIARLMPVMVEALQMSRCECTYWYGPQYGELKPTAPCARCHALVRIEEEFPPQEQSTAAPV